MGIFLKRPQNRIGNSVDYLNIDTAAHTASLVLNSVTIWSEP